MSKRSVLHRIWTLMNPVVRPLAGFAPWLIVVETTGRKTGQLRRIPLASGPTDAAGTMLLAVHGRHSAWVLNLEANPSVRVKRRGRWRTGTATIGPVESDQLRRFSRYARGGMAVASDPVIVHIAFG